jgi:hypothetical protein
MTLIEILFLTLLFGGGLSLGFAVLTGIANLIEGWRVIDYLFGDDDSGSEVGR